MAEFVNVATEVPNGVVLRLHDLGQEYDTGAKVARPRPETHTVLPGAPAAVPAGFWDEWVAQNEDSGLATEVSRHTLEDGR